MLTQRFVGLFLTSHTGVLSLDHAAEVLLSDCDATAKTKSERAQNSLRSCYCCSSRDATRLPKLEVRARRMRATLVNLLALLFFLSFVSSLCPFKFVDSDENRWNVLIKEFNFQGKISARYPTSSALLCPILVPCFVASTCSLVNWMKF